jgi:hypothetical protein
MAIPTQSSPKSVLTQLQAAQNQHDLEAFLACFDPNYKCEQPAHPDRAFGGENRSARIGPRSSAAFQTFSLSYSEPLVWATACGGMAREPMERDWICAA